MNNHDTYRGIKYLKSIVFVIMMVFSFGFSGSVFAQPFTITNNQNTTVNVSPATACGLNYTFNVTFSSEYTKAFAINDNGSGIVTTAYGGDWTLSGQDITYQNWGPGIVGNNIGTAALNGATIHGLIDPIAKTVVFSTSAPSCGSTPTITISETTLTGFTYSVGSGPSAEQSFTVEGSDLTDNISIDAPTNYEISTGTGAGFDASINDPITLTQSGGDVATTTIYVRLKASLSAASYNSEDITVAVTADALSETVTCSGDVTAVPTVVVSSGPAVAAGDIGQNTTNNIVSSIAMTVTDAAATVSAIAFNNSGSAVYTTDVTNYKLYYTATSTFGTGELLGTITSGASFTGLSKSVAIGDGYFWITADIESAATATQTIIIDQIDNTDITITGASKSGANSAGGTQTIIATDPIVTLGDNTVVSSGNIFINTTDNIISRFKLDVTDNTAIVNTVDFTTTGSAVTTTDLTNFQLWYSATNTFGSASSIKTLTTGLDAGSHSFTSLTQSIAVGTGYFWITADIPSGATNTRTVAVSAMTSSAITHSGGSAGDDVSGSTTASGSQQILTAVPKDYYYVGATGGDWSTASNWNTGSCSSGTVDGTPTINDNVYINCNNDRVVQLSANAACASLTIGQQNSGVDLNGYSFTVAGNVDFGTLNQNRFTNTAGTTNTLSIGGNVLIDSYQGYMNIPTYTVTIDGNVTLSADISNIQTTTGSVSIGGNLLIENYQAHITTTTGDVTVDGNVTFTAGQARILTTDGDVTVGGTYTNTSGSESRIEWATGTTTITGDISVTLSNGQQPLKCTSTGWFEIDGGLSQTLTASNAISIPKFRQSNTGFTKAGAGGLTISNIFDQNCGPVEPSGVAITTPGNTINDVCGIIISDTEFTGFNYIIATGPSAEESFTVEGIQLTADISIDAPTNYEISTGTGGGFAAGSSDPIVLTESSGEVSSTTIYIRLKSGLSKASYNSEDISLTSSGHATKTVTCSGYVSAPLSATNSTLTPTSTSITADGSSTVTLTVQAKDEDDLNIPSGGLTVTITKDSGLGTIGAVVDNGDGTYTAVVTSTTTTGTGIFVATIEGNPVNNGGGTQTEATVTYVAGLPSDLTIVAGNNQTVSPDSEVPIAPSILVTDANGNPVSGVDVVFTITAGDGSVTSEVTTTNASGIATVGSWTVGAVAGTNTLNATATAETVTSSIAYPFPQAQFRDTYPYGIVATNTDYDVLQNKIDTWISNFYVESASEAGDCDGVGCARIKWDDPDLTVSEGIAYGMIIFVYADNDENQYQAKFDSLWAYYDYWSNGNGLMNWRIDGFEAIDGTNAATDADLDAALALMQAHKQWGSDGTVNYIAEAEAILASIFDNEVSASGFLKPGDGWNEVQNPSYAALFAIKLADEIQSDEGFTATRDWVTLYSDMQDYLTYYQDPTTGLWPNWTEPDNITTGTCTDPNFNNEGCLYGLDALRTPWRVAWDYAWYGTTSSLNSLDNLAGWLGSSYIDDDPEEITGKLNLDGTLAEAYPLDESGIMGGLAAAYMGDYDSESQTNLNTWYANLMARDMSDPGTEPLNDPLVLGDPDTYGYQYYSPTTQILFGLTLTGNTPDLNTLDPVVSGSPVVFTALGDALLPIELISFEGIAKEKATHLIWKTASETNNDYFTLYKSIDGKEFVPIAQVNGAGNSNEMLEYEYIDDNIEHQGIVYYQLSQTDYDGTQSYSHVISVSFESNQFEIISCKSGINTGSVLFEIQFADFEKSNTLTIVNVLGQVMFQQVFEQTIHEYIEIELSPGMYIVINTSEDEMSINKILIE
jgi:endo-1,4-beta-D-glucanase Y